MRYKYEVLTVSFAIQVAVGLVAVSVFASTGKGEITKLSFVCLCVPVK